MAFCSNCGKEVPESAKFCSGCGAEIGAQNAAEAEVKTETDGQAFNADPADVSANRAMGILSYCSLLVLVPIFAAKNSKYARFHANQGLVLLILNAAAGVISVSMNFLFGLIAEFVPFITVVPVQVLIGVFTVICVVKGIISAAKGRTDRLPLIGNITILK